MASIFFLIALSPLRSEASFLILWELLLDHAKDNKGAITMLELQRIGKDRKTWTVSNMVDCLEEKEHKGFRGKWTL